MGQWAALYEAALGIGAKGGRHGLSTIAGCALPRISDGAHLVDRVDEAWWYANLPAA
jgi:hypothetical protein